MIFHVLGADYLSVFIALLVPDLGVAAHQIRIRLNQLFCADAINYVCMVFLDKLKR